MDCMKANSMMQRFVDGELSFREEKEFVRHLETCRECFDETEVLLLVREADQAFSDKPNSSYDFSGLLAKRIAQFEKQLFLRRLFFGIFLSVMTLAIILFVAILIFYIYR